jgi:Fe-S-cluster containining protein
MLGPQDDPRAFKWHEEGGYAVLDRKDNGDCIYLDNGCSIYGHAPLICQRMDCRELYKRTDPETRARRGKENPQMIRIYEAAEQRMTA